MGRAIVCTDVACTGLRSAPPAIIANNPKDFIEAILQLWRSPETQSQLGAKARSWVVEHHSWEAAAVEAIRSLGETV